MRLLLAWLAVAVTTSAQERGMPPGWVLYVVQSQSCAPCMRWKNDYYTQPQFRNALESSFAVKACNWERLSERAWAQRRGVQALPSFLVYRDGILQQTLTGYDGNWRGFLDRLQIDVGGAGGTSDGAPAPVRPISPEERELPRISALESEIIKLRRLIADAAKKPQAGASPAEKPAGSDPAGGTGTPATGPVSLRSVPPPQASQGTTPEPAIGVGEESSTMPDIGGKWWSVLTTVGKIGLTTLAPEVALPASAALTAAGYVFGQLKKRRGEAAKAEFFRANRTPARDVTEVEQVLSLRQQECRDPLSDAMFGVLFEDLSREDSNKTVGQAWAEAQQRFNRLAPLSSKSATITSSTKEA